MQRRKLFQQSAAHIASRWFGADAPPPHPDYALVRVSRRAMATRFEVAIPLGTPDAVPAAEDALDEIDRVEQALTIYRDTSEASLINAAAAIRPVAASAELFQLLERCVALHRRTDGAFDAAAGALIAAWGFERRAGRIPSPGVLLQALQSSGTRHLQLSHGSQTIHFRREGLKLNFGSIGKGYALDRVAHRLRTRWGIRSALLHGGGSSVLAIGSPPNSPAGWPVAIRHPREPEQSLAVVRLRNQALGTSACTHQSFESDGRRFGHLIDPRSGWPAGELASASAICGSAADADALATALFVLGPEKFSREQPDIAAVVLAASSDRAMRIGNAAERLISLPNDGECRI